jgi:hypothetical protein
MFYGMKYARPFALNRAARDVVAQTPGILLLAGMALLRENWAGDAFAPVTIMLGFSGWA